MIGYLKGKILDISKDSVIVEVQGVGYKVYTKTSLINEDEEKELYIYTSVNQDAIRLFGFSSREELAIFEQLIEVSGVGPRLGQQILSFMGIDSFKDAIDKNDSSLFSAVPKVGPKLATKIIVELKDKVSWQNVSNLMIKDDSTSTMISAMEQLGYKKAEFISLISKIPSEKSESEKIKWLLSEMQKN